MLLNTMFRVSVQARASDVPVTQAAGVGKMDDPAIGRGKACFEEFKDKRTPRAGSRDRVVLYVCAWWGCDV